MRQPCKSCKPVIPPTLLQSTIKENNRTKNWAKLFVLQRGFITFHTEFLGNGQGYVPLVVNTSRSFPRSWLITGFVTRLTRRVSLVEQELFTLPEHLSSTPVFSGVRVTRSLVLYVCFVDRFLSFCTFSFDHCVVCSSSIYRFWLPLWYLQTLLVNFSQVYHRISCFRKFGRNGIPSYC